MATNEHEEASTDGLSASAPEQPADLIPLREAARCVDRSLSSLRSWIRQEFLTKYREEPGNPKSRVMISKAELMAYAVSAGLDPDPPRRGPSTDETAVTAPAAASTTVEVQLDTSDAQERLQIQIDNVRLRTERDGARELLAATRAHVKSLEAALEVARSGDDQRVVFERERADFERERVKAEQERTQAVRRELELVREELVIARLELQELRSYAGSWWSRVWRAPPERRLLTGPVAEPDGVSSGTEGS
jgi:hypothetical protein